MIRLASSSDETAKSLAQTAQMMLNSEDIMRALTCSGPKSVSATTNVTQTFVQVLDFDRNHLNGQCEGDLSVHPDPHLKLNILTIKEWNVLFAAVNARLRQTMDLYASPLVPEKSSFDESVPVIVQAHVEECVQALELLHTALTLERDKRQQLEKEVMDVQVVIAKALVDLATVPLPSVASLQEFRS